MKEKKKGITGVLMVFLCFRKIVGVADGLVTFKKRREKETHREKER